MPLSILDATVAAFSASAAVWYYGPDTFNASPHLIKDLQRSLESTLVFFPHLAGQLQWTDYNPALGHSHRYRRLEIAYGSATDPGVEFVSAQPSLCFSDFIPKYAERRAGSGMSWDCSGQPSEDFLSSTPLALSGLGTFKGLPCLTIQVTAFKHGGVAVGIAFSHSLADATSLSHFVRGWASVNKAMMGGNAIPHITCMFDPQKLDRMAADDIDAEFPDETIIAAARTLPMHRYDQGIPEPARDLQPPLQKLSPATPLPENEWDSSVPVSRRILYFTGSEINYLWTCANKASDMHSSQPLNISRHDALVSHIWMLINRARGMEKDTRPVYLDYSFGFRSRVSPPLPPSFFGSPLMNAAVEGTGEALCRPDALPAVSRMVRATIEKFNSSTVSFLLHDAAFEASPQRLWQAFLGKRHVLLTTWVHTSMCQIDLLNTGHTATHVEAIMPKLDGLVQIMESCPPDQAISDDILQEGWYKNGADVMINITTEAMEHLFIVQ